mmetsp:Transcript_3628/g.4104  ORF Transcript_3628/g.4104 Transcript_3628/m.4104 type:complete len:211 (+) Transcript_3628:718-1350(+)
MISGVTTEGVDIISGVTTDGVDGELEVIFSVSVDDDREGVETSSVAFFDSALPHRDFPAAAAAAILALLWVYKSVLGKLIVDGTVGISTTFPFTFSLLDSGLTFNSVSLEDIFTLATSLSPQRDLPALAAAATVALRVSYNFVSAATAADDEESAAFAGVELSLLEEDDAFNSKANFPSYLAAVASSAAFTAIIFCCWDSTIYFAINCWY